jgi:hypothetical protein
LNKLPDFVAFQHIGALGKGFESSFTTFEGANHIVIQTLEELGYEKS